MAPDDEAKAAKPQQQPPPQPQPQPPNRQPPPAPPRRGSAELRARLHDEIEERSRACAHRRFACHLPRLAGRTRCQQHVLDEPGAPYRRCRYAGPRRCPLPAPAPAAPAAGGGRHQRDAGLCFEHARAALLQRMRALAKKTAEPSRESLLLALKHYLVPERARNESVVSEVSVVSEAGGAPDPLDRSSDALPLPPPDPFRRVDAAAINASIGPDLLDRWSDDSDGGGGGDDEAVDGSSPRRACGVEEDSSGAEDTPYDADALRFAGVYAAEEVVRETSRALRRLRALYVGQLKVLGRRLKETRRTYLHALKSEKEAHCSIRAQGAATLAERRQLATLKAMNSYRRRHGADAVLQKKLYERRAKTTEGSSHRPQMSRCCFTEGGVKCTQPALPAARHCVKHVLNDKQQVLFRGCGANKAGIVCQEPVPALSPTTTCVYHADLLPYQTFSLKKYQSDSDNSDAESSGAAKPNET